MLVDVPGAPLTLVADRHRSTAGEHVVEWSYADPEQPGTAARVRGTTRVRAATTAQAWAQAQLDAAHTFKAQVDEDWLPGVPFVQRRWAPEEAWAALVAFVSRGAVSVTRTAEGLLVDDGEQTTAYHLDPDAWAAYLTGPVDRPVRPDPFVVRAAAPTDDGGLPIGVTDLLGELADTREVVTLVDGRLRGLRSRLS